jgi:hypothetical protein
MIHVCYFRWLLPKAVIEMDAIGNNRTAALLRSDLGRTSALMRSADGSAMRPPDVAGIGIAWCRARKEVEENVGDLRVCVLFMGIVKRSAHGLQVGGSIIAAFRARNDMNDRKSGDAQGRSAREAFASVDVQNVLPEPLGQSIGSILHTE